MRGTSRALSMAAVLALTVGVAAPAQADQGQPVPFKGSEETIGAEAVPDTACPAIPEMGMVGAGLRMSATILGNASHMGRYISEGSWCLDWLSMEETDDPEVVAVTWDLVDLHVTKTAANGDTIEFVGGDFTSTWHVELPEWNLLAVESAGTLEIVGGTGRFADASGSIYNTESSTGILTFSGEILYDASNRAAG